MRLTPLIDRHADALESFLAAFDAEGEHTIPGYFPDRTEGHGEIVALLRAWGEGERLLEGWVPCTTRFLEDGGQLLGLYNFRHRLTPGLERFGGHVGYSVRPDARGQGHATRLLRGAMSFGRELGLQELLLTCDPANVASSRVIEKCGGSLIDQGFHEGMARDVSRYRIRC